MSQVVECLICTDHDCRQSFPNHYRSEQTTRPGYYCRHRSILLCQEAALEIPDLGLRLTWSVTPNVDLTSMKVVRGADSFLSYLLCPRCCPECLGLPLQSNLPKPLYCQHTGIMVFSINEQRKLDSLGLVPFWMVMEGISATCLQAADQAKQRRMQAENRELANEMLKKMAARQR